LAESIVSPEGAERRFPSLWTVAFVAIVAAGGLIGATRGGDLPAARPIAGSAAEHLAWAKDYRAKAESTRRAAELHRTLGQAKGDRLAEEPATEAFRTRCRQVAAAADDLARLELELAEYHDARARVLQTAALPAR